MAFHAPADLSPRTVTAVSQACTAPLPVQMGIADPLAAAMAPRLREQLEAATLVAHRSCRQAPTP
jgi:hypothetical protein